MSAPARAPTGHGLTWPTIAASLLVAGCASRQITTSERGGSAPSARYTMLDKVYRLTERRFEAAYLVKPADGSMTGLPEGDLAPLIVLEAPLRRSRSDDPLAFGAVFDAGGVVRVDPAKPTVYVQSGTRRIKGRSHQVVAYAMFFAGKPPANPRVAATIIRSILDADGFPLLWEVVQSPATGALTQPPQILYASRSLEAAAGDRFGQPLPGRRHSIEPRLEDAPHSVVARIIEDGPMPLGPYLYAAADTGRVTTLHCRCAEAQMDEVVESTYYDLVAFEEVADLARAALRRVFPSGTGDLLTQTTGLPVTQALRWPL